MTSAFRFVGEMTAEGVEALARGLGKQEAKAALGAGEKAAVNGGERAAAGGLKGAAKGGKSAEETAGKTQAAKKSLLNRAKVKGKPAFDFLKKHKLGVAGMAGLGALALYGHGDGAQHANPLGLLPDINDVFDAKTGGVSGVGGGTNGSGVISWNPDDVRSFAAKLRHAADMLSGSHKDMEALVDDVRKRLANGTADGKRAPIHADTDGTLDHLAKVHADLVHAIQEQLRGDATRLDVIIEKQEETQRENAKAIADTDASLSV